MINVESDTKVVQEASTENLVKQRLQEYTQAAVDHKLSDYLTRLSNHLKDLLISSSYFLQSLELNIDVKWKNTGYTCDISFNTAKPTELQGSGTDFNLISFIQEILSIPVSKIETIQAENVSHILFRASDIDNKGNAELVKFLNIDDAVKQILILNSEEKISVINDLLSEFINSTNTSINDIKQIVRIIKKVLSGHEFSVAGNGIKDFINYSDIGKNGYDNLVNLKLGFLKQEYKTDVFGADNKEDSSVVEVKDDKAKVQALSAAGDDRNIGDNWNDHHYWYSIADGMRLALWIRKKSLEYTNMPEANPGEEYSALRQNGTRILLTEPYYAYSFANYLKDDIARICTTWQQMPGTVIIPVADGLHWRIVKIDIDYDNAKVQILFDDPYGQGKFLEKIKKVATEAIKSEIAKLIKVQNHPNIDIEVNLTEEDITISEKEIDQQGSGENSWDCGPIVFSNIKDYIKQSKAGAKEASYSIGGFNANGHQEQIAKIREEDYHNYCQVEDIRIDLNKIKAFRQKQSEIKQFKLEEFKEAEISDEILSLINELPPYYTDMLFTVLENKRIAENRIRDEHTKEDLEYALNYVLREQSSQRKQSSIDIVHPDSQEFSLSHKDSGDEVKSDHIADFMEDTVPETFEEPDEEKVVESLIDRLKEFYNKAKNTLPILIETSSTSQKQNFDKHYVNLCIADTTTNGYNKSGIDRQSLITPGDLFDIVGSNREVDKILLLGTAGVGKSTLLNYISYKWAQGELWEDKFDHVFILRLKTLSSGNWQSRYGQLIYDNPLECFIHSCLGMEGIKTEDIISITDKDKTLLLLDGYDEAAQAIKQGRSDDKDLANIIMREAIGYKYVIMTSRPNAVPDDIKLKFDRYVENQGLDEEGIGRYINKLFNDNRQLGFELLEFLSQRPSVYDICRIPINVVMLSNIWKDPEIRKEIQNNNLTIAQLYENIMFWLGKIYMDKFVSDKSRDIDQIGLEILQRLKVRFLKKVAYEAFKNGELTVSKDIVQKTLRLKEYQQGERGLDILHLYEYGLKVEEEFEIRLKKGDINEISIDPSEQPMVLFEGDEPCKLIGYTYCGNEPRQVTIDLRKHSPVANSQEDKEIIDAARQALKKAFGQGQSVCKCQIADSIDRLLVAQKIINPSLEKVSGKDLNFIHLTFQEYLVADYLKEQLASGDIKEKRKAMELISKHRNEPGYLMVLTFLSGLLSHEKNREGLELFWEAIGCNIDGILDLGAEQKVALLMHVLSEARLDGTFDYRIQFLSAITKLIDGVVSGDLAGWSKHLKESGYLSSSLNKELCKKLEEYGGAAAITHEGIEEKKENGVSDIVIIKVLDLLSNNWGKTEKSDAEESKALLNHIIKLVNKGDLIIREAAIDALGTIIKKETVKKSVEEDEYEKLIELIAEQYLQPELSKIASRNLSQVISTAIAGYNEKRAFTLLERLKDKKHQEKYDKLVSKLLPEVIVNIIMKGALKDAHESLRKLEVTDTEKVFVESFNRIIKLQIDNCNVKKLVTLFKNFINSKICGEQTNKIIQGAVEGLKKLAEDLKETPNLGKQDSTAKSILRFLAGLWDNIDDEVKQKNIPEVLLSIAEIAANKKSKDEVMRLLERLIESENEAVAEAAMSKYSKISKALENKKEVKGNDEPEQDLVPTMISDKIAEVLFGKYKKKLDESNNIENQGRAINDLITVAKQNVDYAYKVYDLLCQAGGMGMVINKALEQVMPNMEVGRLVDIFINGRSGGVSKATLKDLAKTSLLIKLRKYQQEKADIEFVEQILKILGHQDSYKLKGTDKELYYAAKESLKRQLDLYGENPDDEKINEISNKFLELQSISSEGGVFLKGIYHKVLAGNITDTGKAFIIKCMEQGFTTSVTKTGKIIFEGRSYPSNPDESFADRFIKDIARAALEGASKNHEVLAEQYIRHDPLFPNLSKVLPIAASDVKAVKSLINNGKSLDHDNWQVSLMQLSDNRQSDPKETFLLLEGRNIFGDSLVYKIYATPIRLELTPYEIHPDNIGPELRKTVFTGMIYGDTMPLYYVNSFDISFAQGRKLLDKVNAFNNAQGDSKESDSGRELLINLLSDNDVLGNEVDGINGITWKQYIEQELYDNSLDTVSLKIDNGEKALYDSNTRVGSVENAVEGLSNKFAHMQKGLTGFAEKLKEAKDLKSRISEIEKAVSNLDEKQQGDLDGLKSRLGEVEKEQTELKGKCKELAEQLKLTGITDQAKVEKEFEVLSDNLKPYAKHFYCILTSYFNSYKLLKSGVLQGNIQGDKDTIVKSLGGLGLQLIADGFSSVPFIGSITNAANSIGTYIYDKYKEHGFNKKVEAINNITDNVTAGRLNDDSTLELQLASIAIKAAKSREKNLLNTSNETTSDLVNTDLDRLMKYFYEDSEQIIENINNNQSLDIQFEANIINIIVNKDHPVLSGFITIEQIEKLIGEGHLAQIKAKSKAGLWDKAWWNTGRRVEEFLQNDYMVRLFGKAAEIKDLVDNARMVIFKYICLGAVESIAEGVPNLNCVREFTNKYSELINDIAVRYPEFFVHDVIANSCIGDKALKRKVKAVNENSHGVYEPILSEQFIIEKTEEWIGEKDLRNIRDKAKQGLWGKTSWKWGMEVEEFLQNDYMSRLFGKAHVFEDLVKYARMVIFKHICLGVKEGGVTNLKCVQEFTNKYPELINEAAVRYPEFFVDKVIVKSCITDQMLQEAAVKAMSQVKGGRLDNLNPSELKSNNIEIKEKAVGTKVSIGLDGLTNKLKTLYKQIMDIEDYDPSKQKLSNYFADLKLIILQGTNIKEPTPEVLDIKNEGSYNQTQIKLDSLLDKTSITDTEPAKVLLSGIAGIGKSTMLNYIAYQWGQKGLWNDKFDFVFRVKFDALLSDNWTSYYRGRELEEFPLACFIDFCLSSQEIDLENIVQIVASGKTLLLIDGYDEVGQLADKQHDYPLINKIVKEALNYKHIIMTSRPNALPDAKKIIFDRQVENIGLDKQGIELYINSSLPDEENSQSLLEFLHAYPQIMNTCKIPVNLASIVSIWQDREVNKGLISFSIKISQFYEDIICSLSERYIRKFAQDTNKRDITNWGKEKIFLLLELKFLKDIAYEGFVTEESIISNRLIQNKLAEYQNDVINLDILKIYRYGLLRAANDTYRLLDTNYHFIDLATQEYLTAVYFKEQLVSEILEKTEEAKTLIAKHCNELRYLTVLKFLSGLLSQEQDENYIRGTKHFWEALISDLNGELSLDLNSKIKLLIQLVQQFKVKDSKDDSEYDDRISNLKQIKYLIDVIVLQDIKSWWKQIKETGYLSDNVKECLLKLIEGDTDWGFKKVIELKKNDDYQKLAVFKKTGILGIREEETRLITIDNMLISEILIFLGTNWHGLDDEQQRRLYKKLFIYANDKELHPAKAGINILSMLASEDLENKGQELYTHGQPKDIIRLLLEKLRDEKLANIILKGLIKILKASHNKELYSETLGNVVPLLKDTNIYLKKNGVEFISIVVQNGKKEVAGAQLISIVKSLEPLLEDIEVDISLKCSKVILDIVELLAGKDILNIENRDDLITSYKIIEGYIQNTDKRGLPGNADFKKVISFTKKYLDKIDQAYENQKALENLADNKDIQDDNKSTDSYVPKDHTVSILKTSSENTEEKSSDIKRPEHLRDKITDALKGLYVAQGILPKLIEDDGTEIQKLKDYYVKIKVVLKEENDASLLINRDFSNYYDYGRALKTRVNIDADKLFSAIDDKRPTAEKVLILGEAGVGKSTIVQYISYKWATGEYYNEFDYVFRINLKTLLSKDWYSYYDAADIRKTPFSCFVHFCIYGSRLELRYMEEITNRDKVLLLLDGYDEIAHVVANADRYAVIYRTIKEAFNYKYIIMTSRPNALTKDMKDIFDRQVENIGLDNQGIEQYIHTVLQDYNKDSLLKFLQIHWQIKDMCRIPINLALVSLIWKDKEVRDSLTDSSMKVSQLYEEIIYYLGKRYLQKFKKEASNLSKEEVLALKEVQFLKELAYSGFKKGKTLIESNLIKSLLIKHKLEISDVQKYGLLRAEGDNKKVISDNHYFIHLTFQEYFTAYKLYEELKTAGEVGYKAKELIAIHRNELHYLMTLKFLSGIVSSTKTSDVETELALVRYWEAATCNVDGVLELDPGIKITLLMNLLTQAKAQCGFDERIPNLNNIQNLIDSEVTKDITKWEKQIIGSGYLSGRIVDRVTEIIERTDLEEKEVLYKAVSNPQKLKAAAEIMVFFINQSEFGGIEKVFKHFMPLVKLEDWQIQEISLNKLRTILKNNKVSQDTLEKAAKTTIPLITDINLGNCAIGLLLEMIRIAPVLASESLKFLKRVFADPKASYSAIEQASKSLTEVIKAMPSLAEEAFAVLKEILTNQKSDNYTKVVATGSLMEVIKVMHVEKAFMSLKQILVDTDSGYDAKTAAAKSLTEVIKAMPGFLAEEAFAVLKEILANPKAGYGAKAAAVKSLMEVIKIIPCLTEEAFAVLKEILANPKADYSAKTAAAESLPEVIKVISGLAEEVFAVLKEILANPKAGYGAKAAAVKSLMEVIKAMPSLAEEAFAVLKGILINPKAGYDAKAAAVESLPEVIKVMPSLAEEAFAVLKEILANPKADYNAKTVAAKSLTEVIKAMPSLAEEAFAVLKRILINLKAGYGAKAAAIESLPEVIKVTPGLAEEAFAVLKGILINPKAGYGVKAAAAESLPEVIKVMPGLAEEAFVILKNILVDPKASNNVRVAATESLQKVVKAISFNELVNLLDDKFPLIRTLLKEEMQSRLYDLEKREEKTHKAQKIDHNEVEALFKIIFLGQKLGNGSDKDLNKLAVQAFASLVCSIEIKDIKLFNSNLSNLQVTDENASIFKKIYHKLLLMVSKELIKTGEKKEGVEHNNDFIFDLVIKCIESGFITSITRDRKIIFEGKAYQLPYNNKSYIEKIAQAVFKKVSLNHDLLVKQYITPKTLFSNSDNLLKKAATDIQKVTSLIDINKVLDHDNWQVSLMQLSDDKQSEPKEMFLLLEGRNIFGYSVIYKVHEVHDGSLSLTSYETHPDNIGPELYKKVFTGMIYGNEMPLYYANSFDISFTQSRKLLDKVGTLNNLQGDSKEIDSYRELLINLLSDNDVLGNKVDGIKGLTWKKYVEQKRYDNSLDTVDLKIDKGEKALYIGKNAIDNIKELAVLEERIIEMKQTSVLSPELASTLKEHANITAELVKQGYAHGIKLDKHEDLINYILKVLDLVVSGQKFSDAQIVSIKQELAAITNGMDKFEEVESKHNVPSANETYEDYKVEENYKKAKDWISRGDELRDQSKYMCSNKIFKEKNMQVQKYMKLADQSYVEGKYEDALRYYDQIIDLNPLLEDAHFGKGLALSDSGKKPEAVKCFDEAIRLNPDFPEAHLSKSIALSDIDKAEALKSFNQATALFLKKANQYYTEGKYDDALRYYEQVIELNPILEDAHFGKNLALSKLGKEDNFPTAEYDMQKAEIEKSVRTSLQETLNKYKYANFKINDIDKVHDLIKSTIQQVIGEINLLKQEQLIWVLEEIKVVMANYADLMPLNIIDMNNLIDEYHIIHKHDDNQKVNSEVKSSAPEPVTTLEILELLNQDTKREFTLWDELRKEGKDYSGYFNSMIISANTKALIKIAKYTYNLGKNDFSLRAFEKALEKVKDSNEYAEAYRELKQLYDKDSVLKVLLNTVKKTWKIWVCIIVGEELKRLGHNDLALEAFKKTFRIAEVRIAEDGYEYTKVGKELKQLGHNDLALKAFVIAFQVANRESYRYSDRDKQLIKELQQLEDNNFVLQVLETVTGSDKYTKVGKELQQLGRNDLALKIFEMAFEKAKDSSAYTEVGKGLQQLGNNDLASKAFEKALEKAKDSSAYTKVGKELKQLGNNDFALKAFEKALETAKDSYEYTLVGKELQQSGNYDLALKAFEKALETAKDSYYGIFANLHLALDKSNDVEMSPQQYVKYGDLLLRLNNKEKELVVAPRPYEHRIDLDDRPKSNNQEQAIKFFNKALISKNLPEEENLRIQKILSELKNKTEEVIQTDQKDSFIVFSLTEISPYNPFVKPEILSNIINTFGAKGAIELIDILGMNYRDMDTGEEQC